MTFSQRILSVILGLSLSLATRTKAETAADFQLEPFRRRDTLEDREFNYNDVSFLQRFSYRYQDLGLKEWQEGFRGSVGSVRSREFYSFLQVQKSILFKDHFRAEYRYLRDEDFDSRYDRNLIGLGFSSEWTFMMLGDPVADKKDADLQFELSRKWDSGSQLLLGLGVPDVVFNEKENTSEYKKNPYTLHANGILTVPWGDVSGFINHNHRTRLEDLTANFLFSYEQTDARLSATINSPQHWSLTSQSEFTGTRRSWQALRGFAPRRLQREHFNSLLQLDWKPEGEMSYWTGLRYFRLNETDRSTLGDTLTSKRYEWMCYAGFSRNLNADWSIRPEVYASHVDSTRRHLKAGHLNDAYQRVVGKVALPFIWNLEEGAHLMLNPTIHTHRLEFAGFNAQAHFPF